MSLKGGLHGGSQVGWGNTDPPLEIRKILRKPRTLQLLGAQYVLNTLTRVRCFFVGIVPMNNGSKKYRNLCITGYDYTAILSLQDGWIENKVPKWCQYAVGQIERCPRTGKLHLQAYVEASISVAKGGVRLQAVQDWIPGAHVESRKGTQAQAIKYHSKLETRVHGPWVYGDPKCPGNRKDLATICTQVIAGESAYKIISENPDNLRFINYITKLSGLVPCRPRPELRIFWFYGETGIGKTLASIKLSEDAFLYRHGGTEWWDGYQGESEVIFDELSESFPYRRLLQLLDVYSYRAPIKGGFVPLRAETIFITSCKHPGDIYSECSFAFRTTELGRRIMEYGTLLEFGSRKWDGVEGGVEHTVTLPDGGILTEIDKIREFVSLYKRPDRDPKVKTLFD